MRFTEMQRTIYILHIENENAFKCPCNVGVGHFHNFGTHIYMHRSINIFFLQFARYHRRKSITLLRLVHRIPSYYSTFRFFFHYYYIFLIFHMRRRPKFTLCRTLWSGYVVYRQKKIKIKNISVWKFVFKYFGLSFFFFLYYFILFFWFFRITSIYIYEISLICLDSNEREMNELNEN